MDVYQNGRVEFPLTRFRLAAGAPYTVRSLRRDYFTAAGGRQFDVAITAQRAHQP